jgi:phosphopantetheine binding protein
MLSRIREQIGSDLSLRRVFECPTIRELASALEADEGSQVRAAPAEEIRRHGRGTRPLEDLFAKLDELSEEEVDALLSGPNAPRIDT